MESSRYSIVVTTYPRKNREEDIVRCLTSLFSQTFTEFTILVVENYSDNTKITKILSKIPANQIQIRVVLEPTQKLSRIFNTGWRSTDSNLLGFLADDAEADPNWLKEIDKTLSDSRVGVVTGPVISTCYPAGEMHRLYLLSRKNPFFRTLSWPYLHFAMEGRVLSPGILFESGAYSIGSGLEVSKNYPRQEIDLATTTSMGIRRVCLEKANGFNENFNFNHADGDLFIRIKQNGSKIIFEPKVVAYHHVRLGPSRNPYFIGKDTATFYKKHVRFKSIEGFLGGFLNILLLNSYWIYSFLKTHDKKQLRGVTGFLEGILR